MRQLKLTHKKRVASIVAKQNSFSPKKDKEKTGIAFLSENKNTYPFTKRNMEFCLALPIISRNGAVVNAFG